MNLKKNLSKLFAASMTALVTSCASPPMPDLCGVGVDDVLCIPTDPNKTEYRLSYDELLGYTCMSPEDFAKTKAYINRLLEELN